MTIGKIPFPVLLILILVATFLIERFVSIHYNFFQSVILLAASLVYLITSLLYWWAMKKTTLNILKKTAIINQIVGLLLIISALFSLSPTDPYAINFARHASISVWLHSSLEFAFLLNILGFAFFFIAAFFYMLSVAESLVFLFPFEFFWKYYKPNPPFGFIVITTITLIASAILMHGFFNTALAKDYFHSNSQLNI